MIPECYGSLCSLAFPDLPQHLEKFCLVLYAAPLSFPREIDADFGSASR